MALQKSGNMQNGQKGGGVSILTVPNPEKPEAKAAKRLVSGQPSSKAPSTRPLDSSNMTQSEFRAMLQDLASEAEHRLPGPPPKVQRLHKTQKKNRRKMGTVLLACLVLLTAMVYYGIKNADDLPLGLGGILKAYTVGTKAPVPEPGQPLKPNQQPKPMDPSQWGNRR